MNESFQEKPRASTRARTGKISTLAIASTLALTSFAESETLTLRTEPWETALARFIPSSSKDTGELFGAAYALKSGKGSFIAFKKFKEREGIIYEDELQKIAKALPREYAVRCEVHNHPGGRSLPFSSPDIRAFADAEKSALPGRKEYAAVVDAEGVWFMRSITETEAAALYDSSQHRLNSSSSEVVDHANGIWGRAFLDGKIRTYIDAVRSPEYRVVRSAFAASGMYIIYVSHADALKDPCGMKILSLSR